MNCNNSNELYSFHGAGSHAAMCDGSVRFMSANTPVSVVAAWISCQLGEIAPSGDE
jgi:prepilin-type processing-associated H-X9-DG protein